MTYMLCRNRVADFPRWRAVFASHEAAHRKAGLQLVNLWRSVEEPNNIFFLFEVASIDMAREFINDPQHPFNLRPLLDVALDPHSGQDQQKHQAPRSQAENPARARIGGTGGRRAALQQPMLFAVHGIQDGPRLIQQLLAAAAAHQIDGRRNSLVLAHLVGVGQKSQPGSHQGIEFIQSRLLDAAVGGKVAEGGPGPSFRLGRRLIFLQSNTSLPTGSVRVAT